MADPNENLGRKPSRNTTPILVLSGIAVLILIIVIVVLATRPSQVTAADATTTSTTMGASTATSVMPARSASDWTREKLATIVEANTPIQFVRDSIRLLPGEKRKIENIADALKNFKNVHLRFRGHTADFNLKRFQYELSLMRASGVRWMLEYRAGDGITSVTVQGAGSKERISKGDSEAQRAPNRRVEIFVQNAEPK